MNALPTRRLGRTEIRVTVLGYGALELRGAPHMPQKESSRSGWPWQPPYATPKQAQIMLNEVLDSGINFIDTSIDYGYSEVFIGDYISHRRNEYYLATKCGCMVGAPPSESNYQSHIFTRENIVKGVEQSLGRLRTDYIDILQFHAGPSRRTLEQHHALETVLDLKRDGKIRFIGMSSTLPNLLEHIDMDVFDIFQIPYSAFEREHEEVITKAAGMDAGTVIRGGVSRGGPAKGVGMNWDLWQKVKLDSILEGMTRAEFVLRFTITHPDLHTTIVGTGNQAHLRENLNALQKGPLPSDIYAEAKKLLGTSQTHV